eukprot:TRINITY_DN26014_c0_g1_i1.p1 TRINITY_DN26014_c0_g1~~TRINITY_DN26014_c0_g1_i1.p1  ORF type:complete len:617 (-),score=149.03 TRINITY_DN26014_c0_g1_i1:261-2111(-)
MIRRPPRSTLSSSSAASDVYKRQVFDQDMQPRIQAMKECSKEGQLQVSLGNKLDELDNIETLSPMERNQLAPTLFRFRVPVSHELFRFHYETMYASDRNKAIRYGALKVITDNEPKIVIAQQLHALLHMQRLVYGRFSNLLTREKLKPSPDFETWMTVPDVIKDMSEGDREHWAGAWEAYKQAWNVVAPEVTQFQCQTIQIPAITDTECLSLAITSTDNPQEETFSLWAHLITVHCINIHNEVIGELENCVLGGQLSQTQEAIPTHLVQDRDMLEFNRDSWQAMLSLSAYQSLSYGHGKTVEFDYYRLCEWIFSEVLGSHSQVSALIRKFKFAGENPILTGPLAGIDQQELDAEVISQIFDQFASLLSLSLCLERVKQCRGFMQMLELDHDQPLGQFAEVTAGLTADEMKDLGDASGAVRASVMLSHVRDLENQLTERMRPDVLDDLHEMYQYELPEEAALSLRSQCKQLSEADLVAVIEAIAHHLRAHFSGAKPNTMYESADQRDQDLWGLVQYMELPESHPDIEELHAIDCYTLSHYPYGDWDELEPGQVAIYASLLDGKQLKIRHLGTTFAILRQSQASMQNAAAELSMDATVEVFTKANIRARTSVWEQRLL